MAPDTPDAGPDQVAPDEAFAVLGDETRLAVLRSLGDADGPLPFSELRDRVGYDTSGNFSYHLDRLTDHFLHETDRGYALRPAGRRVVEAVHSGAVTSRLTVERTRIDRSCPYCGAPVDAAYREERLEGYCTDCGGVYEDGDDESEGLLGHLPLPPAGIRGRSISEAERAAWTWGTRDMLAVSKGVCPRCAGRLSLEVDICSDHDATDGLCAACGDRHAVQLEASCTTCIFDQDSAFVVKLLGEPALLDFVTDHGLDPVTDHWAYGWQYDEEVVSTAPFAARFTFTLDDEQLSLTVDEDLQVVDSTRQHAG